MLFILSSHQGVELKYASNFCWFDNINYQHYLSYPTDNLSVLSNIIIGESKSEDEKVTKIYNWVTRNFRYVDDFELYGKFDYWVPASESFRILQGDCEDGAFLIHSLLLHVGVKPENIRTYGGITRNYKSVKGKLVFSHYSGHMWTAYKRESDGEWIDLDWTTAKTIESISKATPLRYDFIYAKAYVYFNFYSSDTSTFEDVLHIPPYI